MGKISILLILSLALTSCIEQGADEGIQMSPSASVQANPPTKWPLTSFPLNVKVSEDFSEDEYTSINEMKDEWEEASNFELDFFDDAGTVPNKSLGALSDYRDSELGIYKSYSWFSTLSSYSLAVTQFFGYRRNAGTPYEYIEMTHADIVLNYRDYEFSTNTMPWEYDLPSVVLHELGHFVGLDHIYSAEAVMAPTISSDSEERNPYLADEKEIAKLYDVNSGILPMVAAGAVSTANTIWSTPSQEGEEVQGIHELRSDGSCHHYENGVHVFSHRVKHPIHH